MTDKEVSPHTLQQFAESAGIPVSETSRLAKEAAEQGRIDVIQQLISDADAAASSGPKHRCARTSSIFSDSAPILAAAHSGHADIVFLLLPSLCFSEKEDGGSLQHSPVRNLFESLLTNAAASGNLDLLKRLLLSCDQGGGTPFCFSGTGSDKYDLLAGAHAAAAVHGHVHVLEWLWDGPIRCRFMPADYTKLVLGDCPPTEKNAHVRIRVLEWVAKKGLLCPTGEIVRRVAQGGSVTVLQWLLEHTRDGARGFPCVQFAESASGCGNVDLLRVLHHRGNGREKTAAALKAPDVVFNAIRFGHLGVVQWLFEELGAEEIAYSPSWGLGRRMYRNLPAHAFENGQVDILEFLYADARVPYGAHPLNVHANAKEFFREYAEDWSAGIFPCVNVKPAKAERTLMGAEA